MLRIVSDKELSQALKESLVSGQGSIDKIERCFSLLPECRWSKEKLAQLLNSWQATHLKMLAIYGLSCRLQRLAMNVSPELGSHRQLMLASAYNAETSYEDLVLDYGGETHAQLFNDLARTLMGDYPWSLEKYCICATSAPDPSSANAESFDARTEASEIFQTTS